jgi:glycine dehydrogenase
LRSAWPLHRHPGAKACKQLGCALTSDTAFDTVTVNEHRRPTHKPCWPARWPGANLRLSLASYVACRWTKPPPAIDMALLWSVFARDGQALPSFDAHSKTASSP